MDIAAFVSQALPQTIANLQREYPNAIQHSFVAEGEMLTCTPSSLHPAFYGCYDLHSAVHSCWQVVRAIRLCPDGDFVPTAVDVLNRLLTPENLAAEMAYITDRPGYEMPYGMAWLLQLLAELREAEGKPFTAWREALTPLEEHAAQRFRRYAARLPFPVRTGLHNQSVFSLGLAWDWAQTADDTALRETITTHARRLYLADRGAPLEFEPSGSDFLSPSLAEADLLRRVLPQAEFSRWLTGFYGEGMMESLPRRLAPVQVVDPTDGQLAHYAGLNLSRAWMLQGIASILTDDDPRRATILALADSHAAIGLPDALHPEYMVSHWAPIAAARNLLNIAHWFQQLACKLAQRYHPINPLHPSYSTQSVPGPRQSSTPAPSPHPPPAPQRGDRRRSGRPVRRCGPARPV